MLNTHWGDDGEALFGMTWHGVVFSAAASWQQGLVDATAFDRAFDWAFYRNTDDTFVKAIYKQDKIHSLLASVKAGDAMNELCWFDPFTARGAERIRQMLPVAAGVRLLAEDALVDVVAGAGKAALHRETIPYLRFAARRLDALGLRIQVSKEIGDIYRQSLAGQAPAGAVRRISSNNGLTQDVRESVTELRDLYQTLWLAENRPYWLGNVLARYDHEALYWTRLGLVFADAARQYREEKTLPAAESLGVVLP
jgi:hypothetical protein